MLSRQDAERWLTGQKYDLGIGVLPVNHPDVNTIPLIRVRTSVILPKDHPLSKANTINADQIVKDLASQLQMNS